MIGLYDVDGQGQKVSSIVARCWYEVVIKAWWCLFFLAVVFAREMVGWETRHGGSAASVDGKGM